MRPLPSYGRAGRGLTVIRPVLAAAALLLVLPQTAAAQETKTPQGSAPTAASSTPSSAPAPTDASSDKTVADKAGSAKEAAKDAPKEEAPAAAAPTNETFLHLQSPTTVQLKNSETGQVVCTSPCDKPVPSTPRYKIVGARPSSEFVLAASPKGRADVKVKPASNATFWTGVGALGLGGLLVGAGIGVFVYGVENRAAVQGAEGTETDNTFTDTMSVGTALTVAGTISALVGGAVMVSNYSTQVRGDLSQAAAAPKNPAPAPRAANLTPGSLPRTTFAPLFGGTF